MMPVFPFLSVLHPRKSTPSLLVTGVILFPASLMLMYVLKVSGTDVKSDSITFFSSDDTMLFLFVFNVV